MPERHIPEYEAILAPTYQWLSPDFRQPGDPHKGAEHIVSLLTGSGLSGGRRLLARIPLGDDAYESALGSAKDRIARIQEWKTWSTGTNY